MRNKFEILVGKSESKNHLRCLNAEGRWILLGYEVRMWPRLFWTVHLVAIVQKKNSVASVRERTTPTELSPLIDKVSANFCG
jgi:hypothetical protein